MIIQKLANGWYEGRLSSQQSWIVGESRADVIDSLLELIKYLNKI